MPPQLQVQPGSEELIDVCQPTDLSLATASPKIKCPHRFERPVPQWTRLQKQQNTHSANRLSADSGILHLTLAQAVGVSRQYYRANKPAVHVCLLRKGASP